MFQGEDISKYTSKFKFSVIQYKQLNRLNNKEVAEKFGLLHPSLIDIWIKTYIEKGFSALENDKEMYHSMKKKEEQNIEKSDEIKDLKRELKKLRKELEIYKARELYMEKLKALLEIK